GEDDSMPLPSGLHAQAMTPATKDTKTKPRRAQRGQRRNQTITRGPVGRAVPKGAVTLVTLTRFLVRKTKFSALVSRSSRRFFVLNVFFVIFVASLAAQEPTDSALETASSGRTVRVQLGANSDRRIVDL